MIQGDKKPSLAPYRLVLSVSVFEGYSTLQVGFVFEGYSTLPYRTILIVSVFEGYSALRASVFAEVNPR